MSVDKVQNVGVFTNTEHGIAGTIYARNETTLVIQDFKYDGTGPDAFFLVGTRGTPSRAGTILPYPFNGTFYGYDDQSAPIIKGSFIGDKDITLTLPKYLKATNIKWLSVWCRRFNQNFGDVMFPENLSLDDIPTQETNKG